MLKKNTIGKETLGANIYDLLKYQFFITSPVGEFVKTKINEIMDILESGEITIEDCKKYKNFIGLIGDSYIRNILEYKINKKLDEMTRIKSENV